MKTGDHDLEAQEAILAGPSVVRTVPVWSYPQLLEHCPVHSRHSINTC